MDRIEVAVVGAGGWGRNHVRTLEALPGASLGWVCDTDGERRASASRAAPGARVTSRLEDVLGDPSLRAVVIATPARDHEVHALASLRAGKHVLVEKPMALDLDGARRMRDAAREAGRILMVGHLMVYHPGVEAMRRIVGEGALGTIRYVYSRRVNLGTARRDENALWSLGPHDLSIVHAVFPEARPRRVSARGGAWLTEGVEDVVFLSVEFDGGMMAQIQLSWLDPHKERRLTVVGSRAMATFDEVSTDGKLHVHDRGYDVRDGRLVKREDGVRAPAVPDVQPLELEDGHFLECVATGRTPLTDAEEGLWILEVLFAAQTSLERGGESVELS